MRLFRQSGDFTQFELLLVLAVSLPVSGGDLIDNTLDTGMNLFEETPVALLGSGLVAGVGVHKLENGHSFEGFLQGQAVSALDQTDDFLFGPFLPASSAAVWIMGMASEEQELEETGEELCRGLLWTYGLTAALKYSVRRPRPDGGDNYSFPSAHAAGASCTAAVLWSRHGSTAGIPLAAAALYTCFSRVNMGRHFPSDVLIGAVLGTACGLAASLDNEKRRGAADFSLGFTIDTGGRIFTTVW